MAKLKFDQLVERVFDNGVDHVVLYKEGSTGTGGAKWSGVVWNGVTNISLSPEGGEANDIYADNIKYASLLSIETLNASIEAYMSPKEFDECDGTAALGSLTGVSIGQQDRKPFALAFRTNRGDAADGKRGHQIHILYGCLASPSDRAYDTINDSVDAMTISWDISCTPITFNDGTKDLVTALVTVDEYTLSSGTWTKNPKYAQIEEVLLGKDPTTEGGSDGEDPHLIFPNEILALTNG